MKRLRQEEGLTLIETTVILAVVTILSGMLAPSILQFIEDSKITRAQGDVQAIASGLGRFFQDTGHFPVTSNSQGGGLGTAFIDVLVSDGLPPTVSQAVSASRQASGFRALPAVAGDVNRWTTGVMDLVGNHLVKNRAGFVLRGPSGNKGWNGPYLGSEAGADPWGNYYMVNVAYLDSEAGVADATGAPKSAVYVLCAGPNQVIETPFTQPITNAEVLGDDIAARIR